MMSGIIYIDVQCILHTKWLFRSFLAIVSKMMARVQLLCAEYVVKYGYSSTKLWHSCTRRIKMISERYHLSRLSHFWRSYGDVTVVSVGVLNGLFDIGPLKRVKTWRTTHAACNEYKTQIYVDWWYSGECRVLFDWVMTVQWWIFRKK
jgi:hypothetical protein